MIRSDMNSPDTVLFGRSELWREYHQFEISFMNKMTSQGSINIEKCRARLRGRTLLPIISGLGIIRWLWLTLIISWWGGNLRRRGRRVLGHYEADPSSQTENMYSAPGSKTTIISTSQAIYNIVETAQKYSWYLRTFSIDWSNGLKNSEFNKIPPTKIRKMFMYKYSDEVRDLDSLMKCYQFVSEYFCSRVEVWSHLKYLVLFYSKARHQLFTIFGIL